jgi:small subunit ribosomal protein S6
MATGSPTYDLALLLDSEAPDDQRAGVLSEVERAIQGSGTLVGHHDWGRRRLAYQIRHRPEAEYHLIQFQGSAELIEGLQRTLRLADPVVRFRIVKLPAGASPPPEVRPDRRGHGDLPAERAGRGTRGAARGRAQRAVAPLRHAAATVPRPFRARSGLGRGGARYPL